MDKVKEIEQLCNDSLRSLYNTLRDESIPFEERKKTTSRILSKHVDLSTDNKRGKFVLCMIAMLLRLYIVNHASFLFKVFKLI